MRVNPFQSVPFQSANALVGKLIFLLVVLVENIVSGTVAASDNRVRSYAIVVGNNAPSELAHSGLATLRYADDDVIRVFYFFKKFVSDVHLLTVPDESTQQRYPDIAAVASVPSIENLNKAVSRVKMRVAADLTRGLKPVVYLYFSGHGAHDEQGRPGLVLLDGHLTRDALYRNVIDRLEAEYIHLFVDACYAEGVVGSRGMFDKEENASAVEMTAVDARAAEAWVPGAYPGLGVFVSSSAGRQSHEWSRLESGVFTHVVLSGLSGLADINNDGQIAYSELYAFIAAANRGVKEPMARVNVVVAPPKRNSNVPIVDIFRITNAAFLEGNMTPLGHFYIESENGVRLVDGHLRDIGHSRLWVPAGQRLYLHSNHKEASVKLAIHESRSISSLSFEHGEIQPKGAVHTALAQGLFVSSYGPQYYKGVVDSSHLVSVLFDTSPTLETYGYHTSDSRLTARQIQLKNIWSKSAFAFAALSTGMCGFFSVLAFKARHDSESESDAAKFNGYSDKWVRYGNTAWISAALAAAGITAGILIRLRGSESVSPALTFGTDLHRTVQLAYLKAF
jgi:hypothetical protein